MSQLMTRRRALATLSVITATVLASTGMVRAETTHEVQMLTKHPEEKKLRNVFLPRVLVVEPGDTVTFLPTEKGHNSASSKGMLPEGAEGWKGKINKEISVTFDKPGFYGYECSPHAALGMVGLVIVKGDGMTDNLDAAKSAKAKGKSKKVWKEIWEEVDGMDLGS
ncbi:MAG: pseudoazurin [Silicimonas sp.]|nr:pseudoazurin [Silicimonas sp.]